MTERMNVDDAWDECKRLIANRVAKTSVQGQLDTIASMLQQTLTGQNELRDTLLPKFEGDQTAMDTAAMGPGMDDPLGAMGGAPGAGPEPAMDDDSDIYGPLDEGDEGMEKSEEKEKSSEEEKTSEDEAPKGADNNPMEDTEAGGEEAMTENEDEVPAETGGSGPGGADDQLDQTGMGDVPPQADDDLDVEIEPAPEAPAEPMPEAAPTEAPMEPMDATPMPGAEAMDPMAAVSSQLSQAIKDASHQLIDAGQTDKVLKLTELQNAINAILGTSISTDTSMMKSADTQMDQLSEPDEHPSATPGAEQIDQLSEPDSHPAAPEATEQIDELDEPCPAKTQSGDDQLEQVAKTSDKHGDGEHEEDLTEFEAVTKSIPSFSAMMMDGEGSYHQAMEGLRKSVPNAGAQAILKGGMGAFNGLELAADGNIQKFVSTEQYRDYESPKGTDAERLTQLDYMDRRGDFVAPQRHAPGDDTIQEPGDDTISDYTSAGAPIDPNAPGIRDAGDDATMGYAGADVDPEQPSNTRFYNADETGRLVAVPKPGDRGYVAPAVNKASDMPLENAENLEASCGKGVEKSEEASKVPLDDTDAAMAKSGRHIMTFNEMMQERIAKNGNYVEAPAPAPGTTFGASVVRPELGAVRKSASEPVRMGFGVDPRDVVKNDWAEYQVYKTTQNSRSE